MLSLMNMTRITAGVATLVAATASYAADSHSDATHEKPMATYELDVKTDVTKKTPVKAKVRADGDLENINDKTSAAYEVDVDVDAEKEALVETDSKKMVVDLTKFTAFDIANTPDKEGAMVKLTGTVDDVDGKSFRLYDKTGDITVRATSQSSVPAMGSKVIVVGQVDDELIGKKIRAQHIMAQ